MLIASSTFLIDPQVMRGRLSFGATRDASNQINGVHVRNKDGTENAFLDNQCTRILTYAQQTYGFSQLL